MVRPIFISLFLNVLISCVILKGYGAFPPPSELSAADFQLLRFKRMPATLLPLQRSFDEGINFCYLFCLHFLSPPLLAFSFLFVFLNSMLHNKLALKNSLPLHVYLVCLTFPRNAF